MAVYEVTYKDDVGNPLLVATFNADDPRDGLQKMLSTPSLAPPEGTAEIDVRRLDEHDRRQG